MTSQKTTSIIDQFSPDLNLVATFDQKIPECIVNSSRLGSINIHPSILPDYRGPTPTNWAIINGEKESGVTFHFVGSEYDMGDILYQKKLEIGDSTDGQLRERLAILAGNALGEFLYRYINCELTPEKQSKNKGSYYPKIYSSQGLSILKSKSFCKNNIKRGLTPFPGIDMLDKENYGL